ncbi:MAG: glycosyltransferase family 4 protein [bacterium]
MKILHVNNSAQGGGTETYIDRIIQSLEKEGHTNSLYIQKFTSGNHPIKALLNTRHNLQKLRGLIDVFNPDIIHVHNINNYRLLKFLLSQRPCLKSVHEFRPFCTTLRVRPDTGAICNERMSLKCFKTGCFKLSPGSIYRYMVDKKAARVIGGFPGIWVMSRFMAGMVKSVLPNATNLEVVPYFYDPPPTEPPILEETPRIFTAGRLVQGKGFDVLMDILAKLNIPFELRIAGEGPERERLEKLAHEKNIPAHFLGFVAPEQLIDHYNWSRVVVFPSTYPEPFGIVGLEAMGAARPVVAFDVGGVSDWLLDGQVGYCIPAYDTTLFAEKIKLLLEDYPSAKQMGDTGRQRVMTEFSSERHVLRLMKTYGRLAGKS